MLPAKLNALTVSVCASSGSSARNAGAASAERRRRAFIVVGLESLSLELRKRAAEIIVDVVA
jgi:hypothetical protein